MKEIITYLLTLLIITSTNLMAEVTLMPPNPVYTVSDSVLNFGEIFASETKSLELEITLQSFMYTMIYDVVIEDSSGIFSIVDKSKIRFPFYLDNRESIKLKIKYCSF